MLQSVSRPAARVAEPASPGIRRALVHIERHFTEALYLDDLAAVAGLSVCRFVTVFRRQVGLTPHRFVCRQRVRYARALLADGVPAAQAALDAGFFDQSHLSRHFKSVYGTTPGRYLREQVQSPPSRAGRLGYPARAAFSSVSSSRPA
ncbi:AraC family transcriptional regulator [Bosea vestrisii]|uniref:helix-turn-helix domain-containing protein n=1 Tax=Bosea vestrisii TaxID=151416 RepID=UPI0024DFA978|nr:AraC family transcriptional regulator [Bosea vestrisii]WID98855.1 AraC family transcriptional regulator [Bosea vestrisii]